MEKKEAETILCVHGWLKFVDIKFRRALLKRGLLRRFERGDSVYDEDDQPGSVYGIVHGGVKMQISPESDGPVIGHFSTTGQWFGETAFITGQNRLIGVSVVSQQLLALIIRKTDLHKLLETNPGAWRWIALLGVMNQKLAISAVADLLVRDSYKRFCSVLLRLGDNSGPPELPIHLSQEELAEISNLSRRTVGEFLQKLSGKKIVVARYGQITINNVERLRSEI